MRLLRFCALVALAAYWPLSAVWPLHPAMPAVRRSCWHQVCDDRPEKGATELAALLPLIPDDKLMIETDAPYLTPRTIQ